MGCPLNLTEPHSLAHMIVAQSNSTVDVVVPGGPEVPVEVVVSSVVGPAVVVVVSGDDVFGSAVVVVVGPAVVVVGAAVDVVGASVVVEGCCVVVSGTSVMQYWQKYVFFLAQNASFSFLSPLGSFSVYALLVVPSAMHSSAASLWKRLGSPS